MPQIKAYADVPNQRVPRMFATGKSRWRTGFFNAPKEPGKDANVAFLIEFEKGHVLRTHFHEVDQFQIVYGGAGTLGSHDMKFGAVHFSRAFTPYGPIVADAEQGVGFMTLRAHRDDVGAQKLPEAREVLEKVKNRSPWQITVQPDFSLVPGESGVAMKALDGMQDDRGLAAFSLVMKPGAKAYAPDPSKGDGQYIVVLKGGVLHEGQDKQGPTVIWVGKDEGPLQIVAGPEGCEALVLNYPVPGGGIPAAGKPAASGDFKTFQCILCAFIYDEAEGHPDAGIAPGTRWADVPDDFKCPDCDATKKDFEMIEF